jgi:5-methylcytosine-specific restriction endonuclease McrA
MDIGNLVDRMRAVASVRADEGAPREAIEGALRGMTDIRAWLAASEATLAARLDGLVSFPEKALADATRTSLTAATGTRDRAGTLQALPAYMDALDDGRVTPAHVDAITRATRAVDSGQRGALLERVARLVDVAATATVPDFRRLLDREVRAVQHDDGMARLERQRRATRLHTWTDQEGMWCLSGRFDPLTGVKMSARLDAEVQAQFGEAVPPWCPTDPIEKQHQLQALALAQILEDGGAAQRAGRPEFVVVIDTSDEPEGDGRSGIEVDWGIPVTIPERVLADLAGTADVHAVVVRNGVVLHAPGTLNLGRRTRLANRDQRRALRALYATCGVPGCAVRYDRCKLHYVIWWRHGGRTDLENLIPLCSHHHSKVHDAGWVLTLGPQRALTITLPDGNVLATGPPRRRAA